MDKQRKRINGSQSSWFKFEQIGTDRFSNEKIEE